MGVGGDLNVVNVGGDVGMMNIAVGVVAAVVVVAADDGVDVDGDGG